MPLKESLAHLERGIIKPYKLPKLYDCGDSLTNKSGKPARWFVYYSYLDPETKKFKRFKEAGKLNQLKTKVDRHKYGAQVIKHFTELLKKGYNPFLPIEEQVFGEITTLAQAVKVYIEVKKKGLREKTMRGYCSTLNNLLKWSKRRGLSSLPLKEIISADLEAYFDFGQSEKKWKATTHNSALKTIRAFFAYWKDRELIRTNPAKSIKKLREEAGRHTAYNDKMVAEITEHLKGQNTPKGLQLYQFIQWLYYTCIRPNELIALTIGDIQWKTNTILVPGSVSKTGRTEPVDLSPGLAEVISNMNLTNLPSDWYIFGNQAKGVAGDYCDPKPGLKPVGPNFFSKYYRQVLNELGVGAEYTMYGWEHTRNVHLWIQTKDLMRIMRHNRHTDPKVTMRYLRSLGLLVDTRLDDKRRI
ncbi:hypothetical protein GCM10028818_15630 [Spirosoma horti]